jgi:hypothetical protein
VRADQHVELLADRFGVDAGQGCRCGQAEVVAGVQAEEAKQPRGGLRQGSVRPGEHGTDGVGVVVALGGQRVPESRLVAQVRDELVEAHHGSAGGAFGGDPQRQRQPGAEPGQLHQLVALVVDSVPCGHVSQ